MKVDVVIPLVKSKRDDFELRYSLRSLAEQDWIRDIYLVGHKPDWVRGVRHIEADDPHKSKDANIIAKVLKCAACDAVSDQFVVTSDDHYVLKPVTLSELGPYEEWPSRADESNRRYVISNWCRRSVDTVNWARRNHHIDTVFQSHIPYLVDKQGYIEAMGRAPWQEGNGLVTHVYYNVTLQTPPPKEPAGLVLRIPRAMGLKVDKMEAATFLNHNDPGLCPPVREFLETRFPNPSPWED